MQTMLTLVFLCLVLAMSVGCRQAPLNDLQEGAQDIIEKVWTKAIELGEQLNALGQERWECYHVREDGQHTVFYFKRRQSNAIAHLTNLLRFGALAF